MFAPCRDTGSDGYDMGKAVIRYSNSCVKQKLLCVEREREQMIEESAKMKRHIEHCSVTPHSHFTNKNHARASLSRANFEIFFLFLSLFRGSQGLENSSTLLVLKDDCSVMS